MVSSTLRRAAAPMAKANGTSDARGQEAAPARANGFGSGKNRAVVSFWLGWMGAFQPTGIANSWLHSLPLRATLVVPIQPVLSHTHTLAKSVMGLAP